MTAPVNIRRDGIWLSFKGLIAWSRNTPITERSIAVNAVSEVSIDQNSVQADFTESVNLDAKKLKAIGCYIHQPVDDNAPYRLVALVNIKGQKAEDLKPTIAIGYAPEQITGENDMISQVVHLPFEGEIDQLVVIPNEGDNNEFRGRPICFAICLQSAKKLTNVNLNAHLSVQRLATKPPTMHVEVP